MLFVVVQQLLNVHNTHISSRLNTYVNSFLFAMCTRKTVLGYIFVLTCTRKTVLGYIFVLTCTLPYLH